MARYPADRLTGFAGFATNAQAILVAQRLTGLGVALDQRHREAVCQKRRYAADRARFVFAVVQGKIGLGRGIEFEVVRYRKPPAELVPHIRPQPVAAAQPKLVCSFLRLRRRVDQIAAELADILEDGSLAGHDIVPEPARRKALRSEE